MGYASPTIRGLALLAIFISPITAAKPPTLFPAHTNLPAVIGGENGRQLNAAGDRIYAHGLQGRAARHYYVIRPGPALTAPTTGRRLGRSSIHLGRARLESAGTPARLVIERAQREIRTGDSLIAIHPETRAIND